MREPAFVAGMNRWRATAAEAALSQLYGAAGDAAATLATLARTGDAKAATTILRGLGILDPRAAATPGSEDAANIARRAELDRRAERVALDRWEVELDVDERPQSTSDASRPASEGDDPVPTDDDEWAAEMTMWRVWLETEMARRRLRREAAAKAAEAEAEAPAAGAAEVAAEPPNGDSEAPRPDSMPAS